MACLRLYTCLQGAAPWTNTSCMVLYAGIMFGMPTHHCTDSCTSTKLLCVCGSCSTCVLCPVDVNNPRVAERSVQVASEEDVPWHGKQPSTLGGALAYGVIQICKVCFP